MEAFYPLHVYVCEKCFLVQLEGSVDPEQIFSHYAYFSSHSKGWLKHSEEFAEMIIKRLALGPDSQVIEIGSNDGYLLQFFAQKNIPVLGVDPAKNITGEAENKGIPTIVKFFGTETAKELLSQNKLADLVIGNNIIAQVPDLNGFVAGLKTLLKPSGVITIEFHHLLNLINNNQFDTICHERFSYFSLIVIEKVFAKHGLTIFDAERIPTHGGSLRIYIRHSTDNSTPVTMQVNELRKEEEKAGLKDLEKYKSFSEKVKATKRNLLYFLIKTKWNNKSTVGYGAHAEAHTLLNYCGIGTDFLDYTVDRNPFKQGRYLAGMRIPILHPEKISETKPDYVLILPWAIKKEIMTQMSQIKNWGGRFVVPIPQLMLYESDGITTITMEETQ